MVCDDGNIYVLGGYNPHGRVLNLQGRPTVLEELWKFNLATRKWSKLDTAGFPSTCASSSLVIRGPHLYIYGGTAYPFGQIVSNTLKVCDLSTPERGLSGGGSGRAYRWNSVIEPSDQPEDVDDDSKPSRGYGQSIIFHNHYIYVFGGAVGFYTEAINDLHCLDLSTMTWTKLDPQGELPEGRYKQEIIKDTNWYVFYVLQFVLFSMNV
jgi:N-acetylneuraminic acid mutarotase